MTHLRMTWSFDEALGPTVAFRRSAAARRVGLPSAADLRRFANLPLAALVLLYLTLSGFTCARWCDLIALNAASAVSVHAHHGHVDADTALGEPPAGAPSPVSVGLCLIQPPNPAGWMVPVFREPPVAAATFAVAFVLVAAALPRRSAERPVSFSLPPPTLPPRPAR